VIAPHAAPGTLGRSRRHSLDLEPPRLALRAQRRGRVRCRLDVPRGVVIAVLAAFAVVGYTVCETARVVEGRRSAHTAATLEECG
jgi:hypothetical protein